LAQPICRRCQGGTDICDVRRIRASFERHGERFVQRVLSEGEQAVWRRRTERWPDRGVRYLATRFSAKERGEGFAPA
jgi:holo-[acyl-carrier-protein] synthase